MRRMAMLLAAGLILASPSLAQQDRLAGPEQPGPTWASLQTAVFGDREIGDGAGMLTIEAPYRAHDAATVPVVLHVDPGLSHSVRRLTLIVDENPAPVAAEFEVGPGLGTVIDMSTRIRVNAYSNVRLVAELDDGSLVQTARYVKASGGCSAPALKDAEAALAALGQMKMRHFSAEPAVAQSSSRAEAQVMIRHPNNSGFQIDQVSQLYIPPWFVSDIEVRQGDELVFRMEGGISLSEDPSIRFSYVPNGAAELSVTAGDTEGGTFHGAFPVASGS